ncbi:ribonuclease HII [Lentilactobacillus sp. Marseille-Q4993]|uniref:ribonuclease HII n=1 Tax=Lentilactobacillus sp. Marseille-Q4993 TaxID=3039492 RepID=UPI0024BD0D1B|nr:ribonuclease HII [Lentilactobacillus sp. Marseille-Q4993]
MTIKEIKAQLALVTTLDDPLLVELNSDPRAGVQSALKTTINRINKLAIAQQQFQERFKIERNLWQKGHQYIAGVDEVGRGPLAGPVVSCAVILPSDFDLIDVNDSKQVSHKKRLELAPRIKNEAISVSFGVVDNNIIDKVNIYQATRIAMKQAVEGLSVTPDEIIVDAMNIDTSIPQIDMVKADAKSISVSAASICAKVYRDELMAEYAKMYPGYGFEQNAGYGTKAHLDGLKTVGVCPIHRKTFAPVSDYI